MRGQRIRGPPAVQAFVPRPDRQARSLLPRRGRPGCRGRLHPSRSSEEKSWPAAPAHGSSRGGNASPARSAAPTGTGATGADPCRASATRRPGSSSWGSPRRPTAQTAPAACSRAIGPGEFLYAALHRAGFASQPTSSSRDDGLTLKRRLHHRPLPLRPARQQAHARRDSPLCTVPGPRARPARRSARGPRPGRDRVARRDRFVRSNAGSRSDRRRPKFGHGAFAARPDGPGLLLGSYHVSQQNTQTGRLTPRMFDAVLAQAKKLRRAGPI